MKRIFLLVFILFVAILSAFETPLWQLQDGTPCNLQLVPGIKLIDGHLHSDNKNVGAIIPGSEEWHLGDNGFTITATIKLNRRKTDFGTGYGSDGKFLYDHDIIASKGGEFVFGRRSDRWCDQLYFNFTRDGKWSVPLVGTVAMPPYGTYAHVAITVRREKNDFRGQDGYIVTYFLNGEAEREQMVNSSGPVTQNASPWRLGGGQGIRNDNWSFDGEMTDVRLYGTVLPEEEILSLATASKPAQILRQGRGTIPKSLEDMMERLRQQAQEVGRWALDALSNDVMNGADSSVIVAVLRKNEKVFVLGDAEAFAKKWNHEGGVKILFSKEALLMVKTGASKGGSPIMGMYDCRRKAEVFGQIPLAWRANARKLDSQPVKLDSMGQPCTVNLATDKAPWKGVIAWKGDNGIEGKSNFTFDKGRLSMDLSLKSINPKLLLDDVSFPYSRFRKLHNGVDRLLAPRMSGVVYERPIEKEVPQPWKNYPNGELNMQFHAYYDDIGGIYFAQEDPFGGCKNFKTRGRGGELEMVWTHPVAFNPGEPGGREFTLSGNAVWELFEGDWFDAGQVYRRFLADKARWWIPKLPRTDTPQWMRENTLWILHLVFTHQTPYDMVANLKEIRDYLELPFGLHYYEWFDLKKGSFPHFYCKPDALYVLNELNNADIYVKPYIDNRTWSTMDGDAPGKDGKRYDFQFQDIASKYATRNREGDFTLEGGRYRCAVMCPSVPEWREFMYQTALRLAGHGFHAIYHDEVTTAQPMPCFNPEHGHKLNDPRNWLENGYWKMFERIVALREKYPLLSHDSEDASEPYMQYLDGVCPYRWTNKGQVPLFVSIYSGRTQFNGRIYDHHTPGEPESFYDKMAVQLVGSEQLGWFTAGYLNQPEKRLFVKRMMHLRKALLPYFNEGRMLHPLGFEEPVPERELLWGSLVPEKITNPKVHHSVFLSADEKLRAVIWVNASPDTVTLHPKLDSSWGKVACCHGGNESVVYPEGRPTLTLGPREHAVWLISPDGKSLEREAARLQSELRRIAAFTPGQLRWERFGQPQPLKNGELKEDFEDVPVWRSQPAYRGLGCYELIGNPERLRAVGFQWKLEPGSTYEISLAIKKDLDVSAIVQVLNYDSANAQTTYVNLGADVPADGIWHHVKATFSTDAKLNRCGLYVTLQPTLASVFVDEIHLRKLGKNAVDEKAKPTPSPVFVDGNLPRKVEQSVAVKKVEPTKPADVVTADLGQDGVLTVVGDGMFRFANRKVPIAKSTAYTISCELRKEGELSANPIEHRLVMVLLTPQNKVHEFCYLGEKVPADGQWHKCQGSFTTPSADGDIMFYIYNAHGKGTVQLRNLVFTLIKK